MKSLQNLIAAFTIGLSSAIGCTTTVDRTQGVLDYVEKKPSQRLVGDPRRSMTLPCSIYLVHITTANGKEVLQTSEDPKMHHLYGKSIELETTKTALCYVLFPSWEYRIKEIKNCPENSLAPKRVEEY